MSLTRQIFKHSAIYSFATVLGRLVSFLMLPFYAHIFQTEGYGVIGVLDAALGVLSLLITAGLHAAIQRFYHEAPPSEKKRVISTAVRLAWTLGLCLLLPLLLCAKPISTFLLGTPRYYDLVLLASITLVITLATASAGAFLVIEQRSVIVSILALGQLALGLSLNILLVIVLGFGIIGTFITSLVCASVASLVVHSLVLPRTGLAFDRDIARRIVRFQAPLIPTEIFAYLSRQAELFLVRFMISLDGVGILDMGYKFAPLLSMFVTNPFLLAWRTKNMELGDSDEARLIASRMFTRWFFLVTFLAVLLTVTIADVLVLLTPPSFWPAAGIARIEILTTVLSGANAWLAFGLLYQKKTGTLAIIKSTAAGVKVTLSAAFIYYAGLQGAAYSALFTEALLLAWMALAAHRVYPLPFEWARLVTVAAVGLALSLSLGFLSPPHVPFVGYLNAHVAPSVLLFLQSSPLASWRNGKLIELLLTRQIHVYAVLVKSTIVCAYLGLLFVVEPQLLHSLRTASRMRSLVKAATAYIGIR
jgi:O-antigen/teichoic acid export membrane protein